MAAAQPGPLVAEGRAAPGAQVRIYAWPSAADHLRPGQAAPRKLLGAATASAAGSYAVHAAPAALAVAAQTSGYVNLEADSNGASRFFVWRTGRAADQSLTTASVVTPARIDLSASPEVCGNWVFYKQLSPQWAIVGQSYVLSGASHVTQGFSYSSGQSSTIGIEFSATGAADSFGADGTKTQSAGTTSGSSMVVTLAAVRPSCGRAAG